MNTAYTIDADAKALTKLFDDAIAHQKELAFNAKDPIPHYLVAKQYGKMKDSLKELDLEEMRHSILNEAADICSVLAKKIENPGTINWAHNCSAYIRLAAEDI